MNAPWPPPRGTVLVRIKPMHSVEVGIVSGPSPVIAEAVEVVGGWLEDGEASTVAGIFDLNERLLKYWRLATDEEAKVIRTAYLEHARSWGPDSRAWVAAKPGDRSDRDAP